MPGPVCVKVFNSRYEAEVARKILESHNILSVVWADDAGGMRPDLVIHTGGAKLMVETEVSEEAKSILDSFAEGAPE
ncbi:MAG: hypothetical protein V3W18_10640 [candidate division Zixibacteria bacterium]